MLVNVRCNVMASQSEARSALLLSDVCKSYGAVRALAGLSFLVLESQFLALFGPSSVGKTTALRAIAGLIQPN